MRSQTPELLLDERFEHPEGIVWDAAGQRLLAQAMQHFVLSARAHDRICKVARTIADLAGSELIDTPHVAEAVQYRSLDRKYWDRR